MDKLKLEPDEKKQLMEEIRYFFAEEYYLDLGYIGQERILEFFLEQLGSKIYNMGLDDAKKFFSRQYENAEADFYTLYKDMN